MAQHCGYIVKVEKLRPHTNADKLQIATFFGSDTCVSLDVKIGEIGVYFPSDLQLSVEFCEENHMCRKRQDGTPDTGYLEPDKRNVKAIKLRNEKSDGIYCPLTSLAFTGVDLNSLNVGDTIDILNGIPICKKYIPHSNHRVGHSTNGNHTRKKKVNVAPLFMEHADTEQLAYNLGAFKPGDEIEITLKMHGTSQRTGYLPVFKGYADSWHCRLRNWIWFNFNRITHKNVLYTALDKFKHDGKPIYDWGYVSGTRRTVLENYDGGYYGSNAFREQHSKVFEGKLWKGETVYYEVVGFTDTGAPIMADGNNEKLGKDFVKQYGKTTTFSYGCVPVVDDTPADYINEQGELALAETKPQSDCYVYRMTMTNEDGDVVEYPPDFMRYRCEQMGVKCVPVMWKGTIPAKIPIIGTSDEIGAPKLTEIDAGGYINFKAEEFCDGPDPIGKTHIREGVVVRILNRPKFCAYKHKNHNFKMLSGIIVEAVADGKTIVDDTIIEEL